MLIKSIIDAPSGRKWDIYKRADNEYYYKYYEYFKSIGWRLTATTGGKGEYFTKDCIEWEFDIIVV